MGMAFIPKIFGDISLIWIVFYLLVLVFIIQYAINSDIKFFNKWILILIVYSLIVFASVSWTNHYFYDLHTIERFFARFIAPLVIAIIALYLFRQKENVHIYIKYLMIAAFILSLTGICQMFFGGATVDEEFRSSAMFMNPNGLAIFLVLTIPSIIYGIEKKIMPKSFGWIVIASVIAGIICTVSRKGIITMLIAFLIYYILKKQFKKVVLLGVVFAFLVVIVSGYSIITQRFTQEQLHRHFEGKANMAITGLKMFKKHPIIGLGYEGYYENFGKYFPNLGRKKYDAHNIYIAELANRGLLGFIPFISIFLYPLIISAKTLRQKNTMVDVKYPKDMAVICISSIIPFMMSAYFAGGLFRLWSISFILYTQITLVLSAENYSNFKSNEAKQSGST
jgi:O-antigen ligase